MAGKKIMTTERPETNWGRLGQESNTEYKNTFKLPDYNGVKDFLKSS